MRRGNIVHPFRATLITPRFLVADRCNFCTATI
jgi:hypothetical protein